MISPECPQLRRGGFDGFAFAIFRALRDCGINSFLIVGVATELGIEPTVRQGADLGYLPIVVTDACGAGDRDAGERALASLRLMGDAFVTSVAELLSILRREHAPA